MSPGLRFAHEIFVATSSRLRVLRLVVSFHVMETKPEQSVRYFLPLLMSHAEADWLYGTLRSHQSLARLMTSVRLIEPPYPAAAAACEREVSCSAGPSGAAWAMPLRPPSSPSEIAVAARAWRMRIVVAPIDLLSVMTGTVH